MPVILAAAMGLSRFPRPTLAIQEDAPAANPICQDHYTHLPQGEDSW